MSKPFELNLRYLGQRMYWSWKMYWVTFLWLWPNVMTVALINKKFLVCRIKWEPFNQSITTKLGSYIPLVMLITWLDFEGIPLETVLPNFLWKFRVCFFKVKHSIGLISGMIGPIDEKRKGGASVGYCVNYVTLTFDLTHDLDLWLFKFISK